MTPQALRRTFTSDFTRVAAMTAIGFGITDGEYTPGQIEIWTAATGGSTPLLADSAPRRGPDRLRPYVLGPDGATRVWLGDSLNLDDLVPATRPWTACPLPRARSPRPGHTRRTPPRYRSRTRPADRRVYEYFDCLPTAWLDDHPLLCTGSPSSGAATGVGILEVRGNNGSPTVEPVPVRQPDGILGGGAAFAGEHLYDAVPAPEATAAAVLGGDQDQPVLHIIDVDSGEDVRLVPPAPGRWGALGWA